MLIVGELVNASRKAVGEAIEAGDAAAIGSLAVRQHAAGADYIDVNAGIFAGREAERLRWLVTTVQAAWTPPAASTARTRRPSRRPWACTGERP